MNSDKTSENTPSIDTSRDTHEAGQADRQPLDTPNGDSSGSQEMDRGTSLPDRSEANRTDSGDTGIHTEGSNPGQNAGGGGKGKDWIGLSFEAAQERMDELNQQREDIKAQNQAIEASRKR
jgi:hypothetical protein